MSFLELERLTYSEGARLLNVNVATVWRWVSRPNRYGIRLRSGVLGNTRFVTREWLDQYISETTAAASGDNKPLPSMTRQRRIEQAEAELLR